MSVAPAPPGQLLLTEEQIARRVAEIARAIADDLAGATPHLVCVLRGAFVFAADLARALPGPATIDFLAVSSYGDGTEPETEVRLLKDLDISIRDRHVVIVEDIVDTGLTLAYLRELLLGRKPASLRIATLLSKPSRRKVDVPLDYVAFEIPDLFVVGYGLDHGERFRNLPHVAALDPA